MLRRSAFSVVSLGLAALLATACGAKAPAPAATQQPAPGKAEAPATLTKVTVQLGWLMNSEDAAVAVAQQRGFYKDAGLDVTIHPGGPNIDAVQQVVSGGAQFGIAASNGGLVLARGQQIPVKAIGAIYQKHPFGFFFKPSSGIKGPEDFKGKRIGFQATSRYLVDALLNRANVKQDDVKMITAGSDMAALMADKVDAVSAWVDDAAQTKGVPDAKHFLTFDYGLHYYGMVLFTTDKMISDQRDVVGKFLKATQKGLQFAIDHPDDAVSDVLKTAPNLDQATELATLKNGVSLLVSDDTKANGLLYMNPQIWQDGIKILVDSKQLKAEVKPDQVMTNEFLK